MFSGGFRASWIAVSSTTHVSQVIRKIRPMRLKESLIARPTALREANSNREIPQIRPRTSMNTTAMTMRSNACSRLNRRPL
ncbi:hypothetical protein D3C81_2190100 [compost metagenome]